MWSKEEFFEKLWAAAGERGDFPTLQASLDRLTATLHDESALEDLSTAVLGDFSLSQKVIRLANSAMYASFGGEITTVSKAILVLGVDTVAHLAMGIQLLDTFSPTAHPMASTELKRAMLAGEFARGLGAGHGGPQTEEAVVCALMRQLSRLLVVFYFPDKWSEITQLTRTQGLSVSESCVQVLGVSLNEIAAEAVSRWNLPHAIASALTADNNPQSAPRNHYAWLQAIAQTSADAVDLLTTGDRPRLRTYLNTQARLLGIPAADVHAALRRCLAVKEDLDQKHPCAVSAKLHHIEGKPVDCLARLQVKYADFQVELAAQPVGTLIPLALESLMHAYNFSNCFIMLLNQADKTYGARLGFGPLVATDVASLVFPETFAPDFFHVAAITKKPIFLANANSEEVADRLPAWFKLRFPDTQSVLITQIYVGAKCIALVCGEWGAVPCPEITPDELKLTAAFTKELEAIMEKLARRDAGPSGARKEESPA